jgi:hypothetical protein
MFVSKSKNLIELANNGLILLNDIPLAQENADAPPLATILISGLGGSGTSLIAAMLHAAGLYLGNLDDEIFYEDSEFHTALQCREFPELERLCAARDQSHDVWALKKPNLNAFLEPHQMSAFRNPRLIVAVRDTAAIAKRMMLSHDLSPESAYFEAASEVERQARFLSQLSIPVLLVSYEKCLTIPERCAKTLLEFCGIEATDAAVGSAMAQVKPSRPEYLSAPRYCIEGYIDGVTGGRYLTGWCRDRKRAGPLDLDFWVDSELLATATADGFRQDLLMFGIGDGRHAFEVDLSGYAIRPNSVIRVTVSGTRIDLIHSGKRFDHLPHRPAPAVIVAAETEAPAGQAAPARKAKAAKPAKPAAPAAKTGKAVPNGKAAQPQPSPPASKKTAMAVPKALVAKAALAKAALAKAAAKTASVSMPSRSGAAQKPAAKPVARTVPAPQARAKPRR